MSSNSTSIAPTAIALNEKQFRKEVIRVINELAQVDVAQEVTESQVQNITNVTETIEQTVNNISTQLALPTIAFGSHYFNGVASTNTSASVGAYISSPSSGNRFIIRATGSLIAEEHSGQREQICFGLTLQMTYNGSSWTMAGSYQSGGHESISDTVSSTSDADTVSGRTGFSVNPTGITEDHQHDFFNTGTVAVTSDTDVILSIDDGGTYYGFIISGNYSSSTIVSSLVDLDLTLTSGNVLLVPTFSSASTDEAACQWSVEYYD